MRGFHQTWALLKRCCNAGTVTEIPGQRCVSVSFVVAMVCSIVVKQTHAWYQNILCIYRPISRTIPITDLYDQYIYIDDVLYHTPYHFFF